MYKNKIIGIWGFGVVGKSALNFLLDKECAEILIIDRKELGPMPQEIPITNNIRFLAESDLDYFLKTCNYIIPSPGIDLRPYKAYSHKCIAELDIFYQHFKKPIIAITGSVGKTTVTHLLSELLKARSMIIATGGNIGTGCLDLLIHTDAAMAILEASSFQLEHCKHFTPDIAIITNVYPNHLDRHGTYEQYAHAKFAMLARQHAQQHALITWALREKVQPFLREQQVTYFTPKPITSLAYDIKQNETIFFVRDDTLYVLKDNIETAIMPLPEEPIISYQENLIMVAAALYLLKQPLYQFFEVLKQQTIPEHRLEKVATINGIDFYNDSKSSLPPSTLAALQKLQGNPIMLLIGGISKGVDRQDFIQALAGKVKQVVCFGAESEPLKAWCDLYHVPAIAVATLSDAFDQTIANAQSGDCVLLSPAGASFDLFANYQERGNVFKKMVHEFARKNPNN